MDLEEIFGEPIYVYTRAEAIEDGVLVDVTETAREAGFVVPVALTAALWHDVNDIPDHLKGVADVGGRLWDVLWLGRHAAKTSRGDGTELVYKLHMPFGDQPDPDGGPIGDLFAYRVKMVSGPGDAGEHVITMMRPEED